MKYSQYEEEDIIKNYFGKRIGILVDIGAADGIRNSNTRRLILNNWSGLLVEPNPKNYKKLVKLYQYNPLIKIINKCCWKESVENVDFYIDDINGYMQHSTLSTKYKDEVISRFHCNYNKIKVDCVKTDELLKNKTINFLSIDCERTDLYVLQGIDFNSTKIEMICVEYGSDTEGITNLLNNNGFNVYKKTNVNLIFLNSNLL